MTPLHFDHLSIPTNEHRAGEERDRDLGGFIGGFTDGRYGYLVPCNNGKVARVDLQNFSLSGVSSINLAALDRDDANHGEARTLADACTACVSASAIASAAPFGVPPQLTFVGGVETPPAAAPLARVVAAPLPYLARAPPFLL